MMKWQWLILLVGLSTAVCACSALATPKSPKPNIPGSVGKWRVEVGDPGNDTYQAPRSGGEDGEDEAKPPSEAVLRWPGIITPHAKVTDWDFDDGRYETDAEVGDEEYQFKVTPEGDLVDLEYDNDATDVEEDADELVLKGTKKAIDLSEVPQKALKTLAKALPNSKPGRAFTAQTVAGLRYGIVVDKTVFYARPDGQIQAAGLIANGALDEVDPSVNEEEEEEERRGDPRALMAKLEKLLGPHRERFNLKNQVKKLGTGPGSADGSYRYVVLGDTRSQWDLWSSIVKHIDSLVPKPDFVMITGDVVPEGYVREFHEYYIPPLIEIDIPYFIAIGNHEAGDDEMAREFRYLFGEDALNYYFDYGRSRYICFDNSTEVNPSAENLKWLDRVLANTPKGHQKYVACHKPPANIEKWAYHAWEDEESKTFTDLMTKHQVAEVYLGHIHAYSTATFGGVQYTLSGGGGASLHDRFGPLGNVHHYLICDVMPDGAVKQQVVRFYDTEKEE